MAIDVVAMKAWQDALNAAFRKLRPRNVRFQFFTDYEAVTCALWREGGKAPKGAERETQHGLEWYGFTTDCDPVLTGAQAETVVAGLFAKFGV